MASKKNQWSKAQLNAAIRRVKAKEISLRQAAILYMVFKEAHYQIMLLVKALGDMVEFQRL